MALDVKKVEYFNITVDGHAGVGGKLLTIFAGTGVNLLAFKAVPAGSDRTRFSLFPDDSSTMKDGAQKAGLTLDGPYTAVIVKGYNDEPGECAAVHEKISRAGITMIESSGFADIKDSYGISLYLDQEDCERAMEALRG